MGEGLQRVYRMIEERNKQEKKERRKAREALPSLNVEDIQVGKTYHNGGTRKRTVIRINFPFVEYSVPSKPSGVYGEPIDSFAKWAKGVVEK